MVFIFDDHILDIERRELRRGTEPIALEPQVFDLLAYLVHNRDRVVSKDDLIRAVWRGRIVSDSALTTRLNAVRRAVMAGKPDHAIELEVSLRLSPRAQIGAVHTVIGASHFLGRRFDEARAKLLLAIEETPNFPVPYRYLAACYAHMGRLDQARDVVTRLRAITRAVIQPRILYLSNGEHRELCLWGLRLGAGEAN